MLGRIERKEKDKVHSFIDDVGEGLGHSPVSSAVCFIKYDTGEISAITTDGDAIGIMGLIEVGKNIVYENRWEDD